MKLRKKSFLKCQTVFSGIYDTELYFMILYYILALRYPEYKLLVCFSETLEYAVTFCSCVDPVPENRNNITAEKQLPPDITSAGPL